MPSQSRLRRMRHGVQAHSMLARKHGEQLRCRPVLVGGTYRPGVQWAAGHIPEYVERVQAWARRQIGRPLAFERVCEMQQRGALHWHTVWWVPRRLTMPKADKRGWWPHGSTSTGDRKGSAVIDPAAYCCKYISKGDGAPLPKGARVFAAGGLPDGARIEYRWLRLPKWALEFFPLPESVRRVPGGLVAIATGEFARSPFDLVWHSDDWAVVCFQQVRPLPVRGA